MPNFSHPTGLLNNNNNNWIYKAPHGRNFRGAVAWCTGLNV